MKTKQEKRYIQFDQVLQVEAYQFVGIMQKFPNHFHDYYVIGFVENGCRKLTSKNKEYIIEKDDLILINPLDNHACEQIDANSLDWRCININKEIMRKAVIKLTGKDYFPVFTSTVIYHAEAGILLKELHNMIMTNQNDFVKEEKFFFLIKELISQYTEETCNWLPDICNEIQRACNYMEQHYTEVITLDKLSEISGLKKYTLIRYFTKQRGITPYQYLETLRINKAKNLLEKGVTPLDTAMQTGFADQSHFTHFFKNFIGLTPKQYQDIFNP